MSCIPRPKPIFWLFSIAGSAALCLIGLGIGVRVGILPPPTPVWSHHYSWAGEIAVLIGAIIFFFMNAYLAGTLSDQLKMAKGEIEGVNLLFRKGEGAAYLSLGRGRSPGEPSARGGRSYSARSTRFVSRPNN